MITCRGGSRGSHTLGDVFSLFESGELRGVAARAGIELPCTVWQVSVQPRSGSGPVHTAPIGGYASIVSPTFFKRLERTS